MAKWSNRCCWKKREPITAVNMQKKSALTARLTCNSDCVLTIIAWLVVHRIDLLHVTSRTTSRSNRLRFHAWYRFSCSGVNRSTGTIPASWPSTFSWWTKAQANTNLSQKHILNIWRYSGMWNRKPINPGSKSSCHTPYPRSWILPAVQRMKVWPYCSGSYTSIFLLHFPVVHPCLCLRRNV